MEVHLLLLIGLRMNQPTDCITDTKKGGKRKTTNFKPNPARPKEGKTPGSDLSRYATSNNTKETNKIDTQKTQEFAHGRRNRTAARTWNSRSVLSKPPVSRSSPVG